MSEADTKLLDALSREELLTRARELSIERPELMTRVELRDEIVRLSNMDEEQRKRARGWLGVARDLVASVVEQRLNLPDAAELIRGTNLRMPRNVPPVATVTLAEIYAAQGHLSRAIKLLDEVLLREPDHAAAATLRQSLVEQAAQKPELVVQQSDFPEPIEPAWATPAQDSEPEWERDSAEIEVFAQEPLVEEAETNDTLVPSSEVRCSQVVVESAGTAIAEANPTDTTAVDDEPVESALENDDETAIAVEDDGRFAAAVESLPVLPRNVTESMIPDPEVEVEEVPAVAAIPVQQPSEELIYRRTASSIACHWSLSDETWDAWLARCDGQWVIRILEVGVAEGPFECDESDLILPGTSGEVLCHDVESTAQVRMAVGWKTADHFYPVAIGVEIAGDEPNTLRVAWQPLPGLDDPPQEFWLQRARDCWHALSMGAA